MKSLIELISNPKVSNNQLIDRLKEKIHQIEKSVESNEKTSRVKGIEERILHASVPKDIAPNIMEANFANSLDYKKELIKSYLKKPMEELTQSETAETTEIECIQHLQQFLTRCAQKGIDTKEVTYKIDHLNQLQTQYTLLKSSLTNEMLKGQLTAKFNEIKLKVTEYLKSLAKRESKKGININIGDIRKCIPKIKDQSIFIYWMFKIFEGLLEYDSKVHSNSIKCEGLKLYNAKEKNMDDMNFYRLDFNPCYLSFKSESPEQATTFLDTLQQTFELVVQIQTRIKNRIVDCSKLVESAEEKERYDQLLSRIERQMGIFYKSTTDEILPTLYLFGSQNRKRLLTITGLDNNTDTMPWLLMSYRYCIQSKETQHKFKEIAHSIADKLVEGGDKELQQVCFFLEMNSKVIKVNERIKSLKGIEFSAILVRILIEETIDRIKDYSKIEKLLRVQNGILEFSRTQTSS